MSFSLNEKYLLKFISDANNEPEKNCELIDLIRKLGIRLKFKNENPIYQIIDELRFENIQSRK